MQLRFATTLGLVILLTFATISAAPPEARHGVAPDAKAFPRASPKETFDSVLKAIDSKRFDYLLAHLAEPKWVDEQLKARHGGDLERMSADLAERMTPYVVKLLKKFEAKGEWDIEKESATLELPNLEDKAVHFVKVGDRWYLVHRWGEKAD